MKKHLVKKYLAGAAALLMIATTAKAADLPNTKGPAPFLAPVAATWTGCYVGLNGGGGWASKSFDSGFNGGRREASYTAQGWAGGVQAGCDYQINNNWVAGIQAMWDWSSLKGDGVSTLAAPNTIYTTVRSFGTATVQIGYLVMPSIMLFGKGGVGYANDRYFCGGPVNAGCLTGTGQTGFSSSGTRFGWDAGLGVAWMFAPHWDLRVEYDHIGFGKAFQGFNSNNGNGNFFPEGVSQSIDKVLVGVNYRF